MNSSIFNINNAIYDSFTFKTTKADFNGSMTKANTSQKVRWVLNGEKAIAGDSSTYTMTGSSAYTVVAQVDKASEISTLNFNDKLVYGNMNLYRLTGLTEIDCGTNGYLTAVTFPSSSKNNLSKAYFYECDLRDVDFSNMTKFGGEVYLYSNPQLTAITLPSSSSANIDKLYVNNCDLRSIDLNNLDFNFMSRIWAYGNSNLTYISPFKNSGLIYWARLNNCDLRNVDWSLSTGGFYLLDLSYNYNLTAVTFFCGDVVGCTIDVGNTDIRSLDVSSILNMGSISTPYATNLTAITVTSTTVNISTNISNCPKLTTLDLSAWTNGNSLSLNANSGLTSVSLPRTTNRLKTGVALQDCSGLTSIDFSVLSGSSNGFSFNNCPNIATATFPTSTGLTSSISAYNNKKMNALNFYPLSGAANHGIVIDVHNNNWGADVVNTILYDLDTIGWTAGTLDISANGAPDGSSGGHNGLTAKSNLEGKSWTVSTT